MKKTYQTPKAIFVDYSFDDNVVASSTKCSGAWYVFQKPSGCEEYKHTDYQKARSLHPCDLILEGYPFADPPSGD